MRINAIVVNLLKNIQPIRWMVIQKYVTEQNGSAFLELFFPFIPFIERTASLTTFKKRHRLPWASSGTQVKYNLATITTIRKWDLKFNIKNLKGSLILQTMFTSVIKMKTKVKTFVSTIFLVFSPISILNWQNVWRNTQTVQLIQTTKRLTSQKKVTYLHSGSQKRLFLCCRLYLISFDQLYIQGWQISGCLYAVVRRKWQKKKRKKVKLF